MGRQGADFVCLEPWCGIADSVSYNTTKREGGNREGGSGICLEQNLECEIKYLLRNLKTKMKICDINYFATAPSSILGWPKFRYWVCVFFP